MGVKAEKKVSTPSLSLTNPTVGQVIGSDGKNYAAADVPTGVEKVAMIAYVNGSNGLALALTDEGGAMNWRPAMETIAAHTAPFTGGTWKLPTQDEWKQMLGANGGNDASTIGLNTALAAAGGDSSKLQEGDYWSSTPGNDDFALEVYLGYSDAFWYSGSRDMVYLVRACLAF